MRVAGDAAKRLAAADSLPARLAITAARIDRIFEKNIYFFLTKGDCKYREK
jgi:hypothetical protein